MSHTTIARDLSDGTDVPQHDQGPVENQETQHDNGTDVPPAWFQDDVDPAKRATARMLGVDHATVNRDLRDGANAPETTASHAESGEETEPDGANAPEITAWFQDDVDPVKLAKGRAVADSRAAASVEPTC